MDNTVSAGVRKRQQIKRANRTMFLWIAGVSAIVGVAVVLSIFLVQKIVFGEKVIAEKNKTVDVLQKNLQAVDGLKQNINVLNTNEALNKTKLKETDTAIQSVLDALPANANPTALASSLQTKLLAGIPGVTLEALSVDSPGVTTGAAAPAAPTGTGTTSTGAANQINYSFSVSAGANNYDALRQVLARVERSIRPFNNQMVSIETQGEKLTMKVDGASYYELARTLELKDKVVKP